jgi:hypothetical protein
MYIQTCLLSPLRSPCKSQKYNCKVEESTASFISKILTATYLKIGVIEPGDNSCKMMMMFTYMNCLNFKTRYLLIAVSLSSFKIHVN